MSSCEDIWSDFFSCLIKKTNFKLVSLYVADSHLLILFLVFSFCLIHWFEDNVSPSLFKGLHKYNNKCSHMGKMQIDFLVDFIDSKRKRKEKKKESEKLSPAINVSHRQESWGSYHVNDSLIVTKLDNGNQTEPGSGLIFHRISKFLCAFMCWWVFYAEFFSIASVLHDTHLYLGDIALGKFSFVIMLKVALFLNITMSEPDPRQMLWAQLLSFLSSTISFI